MSIALSTVTVVADDQGYNTKKIVIKSHYGRKR